MIRSLATIVVVASAVTIAQVASAADLPHKAPALTPPPPVFSWTGFYIGGHAGYRWAEADAIFPRVQPDDDFAPQLGYRPNSFVGGIQGGYNYQFAPNWVAGVEADWSWGNGEDTQLFDTDQSVTVRPQWNASLRGRL